MSPTARSEQQSAWWPVRVLLGRGRAARSPLPILVTALAVLGGCAILLLLVSMGTCVSWGQLPQLLATPSAQAALWLSIRTCLSSMVICVVLGAPLVLLLARSWPRVRVARIPAVLPMTMPPVVVGIALLPALGNRGLLGTHLKEWGVPIAFSTTAAVIVQMFVPMPFLVVTLEAALHSRNKRAEVTAWSFRAGPWRVPVQVTPPLTTPVLARGMVLALGRSLGESEATIAFAGSEEDVTRTMLLTIYLEREEDTATSLALAAVLTGLSFVIVGATSIDWGRAATHLLPRHRLQGHQNHDVAASGSRGAQVSTQGGDEQISESPRDGRRGQDLQVTFELPERGVAVGLEVEVGYTTALIGPNDSGKSTVCSVVAGLLDAENGQVVLGGRVLDGPGGFVRSGRRQVVLFSQKLGVFAHMSVLGNVVFALRCQGVSRAEATCRARAELAAVGADRLAFRPGRAFSGRQAARVALARVLAIGPRPLILDEPMATLDVTARQEMCRLAARRCAEEGLMLPLVTHDVLDLTALAEDVAVLGRGRVAGQGPTARILSAPCSDFAAHLTEMAVLTEVVDGDAEAPGLRLPSGQVIHGRPREDSTDGHVGEPGHQDDHDKVSHPGAPGIVLVSPDAVALYHLMPHGSPRNALTGRVTGLERSGALMSVRLELEKGQRLSAAITAGAVAELGITEGREVCCVTKVAQVRTLARRG